MKGERSPVLILGAGINGAALAREFLLNGFPVWLVDEGDISSGATAASTRLIHGGLRYLEYGEFDLVKESLAERTRLLRLAPHLVRPLRIFIPVTSRLGGVVAAARRFFHLEGRRRAIRHPTRGLWLVRAGLRFYDNYARDPMLPRHAVHAVDDDDVPRVAPRRYLAMCSYSDAQIRYPERFVVELLEDATRIARHQGLEFEVRTYHSADRDGGRVLIEPAETYSGSCRHEIRPRAIINATGAWVDRTLSRLGVPHRRLIGGTKGSHLVVHHAPLRDALRGQGLYAEARDGRPVFILPFGDAVLIGTTDIPFDGDPRDAVADREEIDYLLDAARSVIDGVEWSEADVTLHYSGVRPLPNSQGGTMASITRRHWLEPHRGVDVPFFSVVGGKLTTCRALAEESVATVLRHLGVEVRANSRERPLPGGREFPDSDEGAAQLIRELADRFSLDRHEVTRMWQWFGIRTAEVLEQCAPVRDDCVAGTSIPRAVVRWMIDHEWTERLEDLVERRLLLLFQRELHGGTLEDLAHLLVEAGKLEPRRAAEETQRLARRLERRYGRKLVDEER